MTMYWTIAVQFRIGATQAVPHPISNRRIPRLGAETRQLPGPKSRRDGYFRLFFPGMRSRPLTPDMASGMVQTQRE